MTAPAPYASTLESEIDFGEEGDELPRKSWIEVPFVEPMTLEGAYERRLRCDEEIRDIAEQLRDPELPKKRGDDWTKRARSALRLRQNESERLSHWIRGERRRLGEEHESQQRIARLERVARHRASMAAAAAHARGAAPATREWDAIALAHKAIRLFVEGKTIEALRAAQDFDAAANAIVPADYLAAASEFGPMADKL